MRPLLILDVDGTLLPYTVSGAPLPEGFVAARAGGVSHWLPVHLRDGLAGVAGRFDTVWCTDWEHAANTQVSPLFGLSGDLPVLARDPGAGAGGGWWKLDVVSAYAGERPLVWADDDMRPSTRAWAAARAASTLLLTPARDRGLSAEELAAIQTFAG